MSLIQNYLGQIKIAGWHDYLDYILWLIEINTVAKLNPNLSFLKILAILMQKFQKI